MQTGLHTIRDLSWQELEYLVGEAYSRQGYVAQPTGSASGDGGVDVVLTRGDELVLVQCKQWRTRRVGVKPIRELYGVMMSENAAKAILVTCGSFTGGARRFAEGKPLALVDGPELWELVRSVKTASPSSEPDDDELRAKPEATESTPSPDSSAEPTPQCPRCGAAMVLRKAKKGPNAGSQFWACSRFPPCRGTREHP